VISCDALICILFAINILWTARSISLEQYLQDKSYVQMPDFAVRVKNLPKSQEGFDSMDQLAA
jgi:hypothetical protein